MWSWWVVAALAGSAPEPLDVQTDFPTVLSISLATYVSTALLHEGLGHQTGCALQGGQPLGFSTANAGCDPGGLFFDEVGGALVGNGVGALATGIPLVVAPPTKNGAAYYALWLHTLVNLQQIGGYMMVGAWIPVGDWGPGGALSELDNPLPAQIALSATGLAITAATIPLAHHWGKPLFGDDMVRSQSRRRMLTWTPWLAGSSLIVGSAFLNRAGPEFAATAAFANFAGTLFLAYLPVFFADDVFVPGPKSGKQPLAITRQPVWWVVGGIAAVGAVAAFGPGIGQYPEPHPLAPR
jgi:hypothetical protein